MKWDTHVCKNNCLSFTHAFDSLFPWESRIKSSAPSMRLLSCPLWTPSSRTLTFPSLWWWKMTSARSWTALRNTFWGRSYVAPLCNVLGYSKKEEGFIIKANKLYIHSHRKKRLWPTSEVDVSLHVSAHRCVEKHLEGLQEGLLGKPKRWRTSAGRSVCHWAWRSGRAQVMFKKNTCIWIFSLVMIDYISSPRVFYWSTGKRNLGIKWIYWQCSEQPAKCEKTWKDRCQNYY